MKVTDLVEVLITHRSPPICPALACPGGRSHQLTATSPAVYCAGRALVYARKSESLRSIVPFSHLHDFGTVLVRNKIADVLTRVFDPRPRPRLDMHQWSTLRHLCKLPQAPGARPRAGEMTELPSCSSLQRERGQPLTLRSACNVASTALEAITALFSRQADRSACFAEQMQHVGMLLAPDRSAAFSHPRENKISSAMCLCASSITPHRARRHSSQA